MRGISYFFLSYFFCLLSFFFFLGEVLGFENKIPSGSPSSVVRLCIYICVYMSYEAKGWTVS